MTQRKLPTCVEAEVGARSAACAERRLDEGARALGGGIGGAGSILVEGDYRNGVEFCQTGKTEAYGEELCGKNVPRYARGWVALKRSLYNIAALQHRGLPTMHGAVELAIDGQVCAAVRVRGGDLLVDIDAEAGGVAGVHHSVGEGVGVGEDAIGFIGVAHVFLNAKIVDAEIEVERGGHADGAHIGGAVTAGADVVEVGEAGDFSQLGNSAGVHDGGAAVIDPLFLDELLAIVDGIEDFTDGEGRGGVAADQAKTFLQLGGRGIFEPEEMIGLEFFAEAGGFDGRKAMVHIVEQGKLRAEFLAQAFEQAGHEIHVQLGAPGAFEGHVFFGGLVKHFAAANAVGAVESGDATLRANRFVAELGVFGDGGNSVVDIFAAGVAIHQDGFARGAAEQLIDGNVERFAFDVPERSIDRGDGGHGNRAATPVRPLVQILPEIFDAACVAANQKRDDVIREIAGDR